MNPRRLHNEMISSILILSYAAVASSSVLSEEVEEAVSFSVAAVEAARVKREEEAAPAEERGRVKANARREEKRKRAMTATCTRSNMSSTRVEAKGFQQQQQGQPPEARRIGWRFDGCVGGWQRKSDARGKRQWREVRTTCRRFESGPFIFCARVCPARYARSSTTRQNHVSTTTMTPRQDENGTMTASSDTPTPSKHPKDWILALVKKHSAQNTQNTPASLRDRKILAVAPMVDQSDLPFRLLCRRYGANVAFTPMIHCKLFCTRDPYQKKFFNLVEGTPPQDRPLIAQLCGSDEEYVIQTATMLQPHVDGIDLNCGCPQGVRSFIVVSV